MPTDSLLSSLLSIHRLLQRHLWAGISVSAHARTHLSDACNRIYDFAVRAVRAETADFNLEKTSLGKKISNSLTDIGEYLKSRPQDQINIDVVISMLDAVLDLLERAISSEAAPEWAVNIPKLQDLLRRNDLSFSRVSGAPANTGTANEEQHAHTRVVNTGFASQMYPDVAIDRRMPLQTGKSYYFWVEISKPSKGSIEEVPADIPSVGARTRLTVVVFGFQDGLLMTPGSDIGEMETQEDGAVNVVTQPFDAPPLFSRRLAGRLFFPVRCPSSEGTFRMRCNIYWGQILLQSREIHACVMAEPHMLMEGERALRSLLDYTLSQELNPGHLTRLAEHSLSILLNSNGDGTNSLHVYGSKGTLKYKKDDIRFQESRLQKLIELARGSLRIASWGSNEEWKEGLAFKYQDRKRDLARLSKDLINMAQWGREFYIPFKIRTDFEEVLCEPSLIQIAMKDTPAYVLPAAMIYDYPLDVGADNLSICQSFAEAFKQGSSLKNHECFKGNCPSRQEEKTVCPSGFWGFRHYIGMPLSLERKRTEEDANKMVERDITTSIRFTDDLTMVIGAATDFRLLQSHEESLRALNPNLVCQYADTREKVFEFLQSSPHFVYFYCHGALLRDELSYLQVGAKDKIFPSNFDAVRWNDPQPLVFLNGCRTIDPIGALNFIEPLVQLSKCSGVIGTEITIYEELATVFAEEFFNCFLGEQHVGMSIRNARLKLLEEGNPLGLVYIPYAIAGLKVEKSQ